MRTIRISLALMAAIPGVATAQSLASRVAAVKSGAVVFHYAPRPGVCGDGESFVRIGRSYHGTYSRYTKSAPCDYGPVQVKLTLDNGAVGYVETRVGRLRMEDARDLGAVSSKEAATYLLGVAKAAGRSSASNAIMGAVIADSAVVWPALIEIARDRDSHSRASRDDALFWLSQFAASALNGRPNDLFADDENDDDKDDIKSQAVFVLSQLPDHGGFDELVNVARTNKDPRVRGKAIFWLGQGNDPRAIDLFEQILRK